MRLALIGAAGKTGQQVLHQALARGHSVAALSRRPLVAPAQVTQVQGDALDVRAISQVLNGCDAAICVIGPSASAPKDQDGRLGSVLVSALRAAGVRRLAIVTGAMQADPPQLGAFYRRVTQLDSVRPLLKERRKLEQELLASGLEVTIARPPRLTDRGPSVDGPERTPDTVISLLDSCSRADLATALLDAVESGAGGTEFVRSRPRDGTFWRAWLARCGLAEFAGITLAAVAALAMSRLVGEPTTAPERWLTYLVFLVTGALEGALIGLAQASVLRRLVPDLPLARFVVWTMVPAVLAWGLGMGPSTFLDTTASASAAPMPEPPVWLVLVVSGLGGGFGGALIGGAQALALRGSVRSVRGWILASALGWALALPLDMLGATLPDASTPGWAIACSAALFGLLAGLTFAVPTGLAALALRRAGGASFSPAPAGR